MQRSAKPSMISDRSRQMSVTAISDQPESAQASWSMDVATDTSNVSSTEVRSSNTMPVFDVVRDESNWQLLCEYTRDKNKQLLKTVKKPIYAPSPNAKNRDNLIKDFCPPNIRQPEKLEKPRFSNKWFLDYLDRNQQLLETRPHFVCPVSTLKILLCAPYEYEWMKYAREGYESREWKIYCKKVNGIWYLSEAWPDYNDNVNPCVKFAARVFELLNTETGSLREARTCALDYLRHTKTYQVFLTNLGEYRLLYSGDVDCIDQTRGYPVELKTTTKWHYDRTGRKRIDSPVLRYYWAQALLMRVKKVLVGYTRKKNEKEIILEGTEEFDSESIRLDASATWKSEICIACLQGLLRSINVDAFFQGEKTTYELWLDKEAKEIRAKKSTVEFPMNSCMERVSKE